MDIVEDQGPVSDGHEFFIVRSASNKESKMMEAAYKILSKKENHGLYAMFKPDSVKGYIFVEAENITKVVDAFREVPNSKGVIRKAVDFSELEKYFEKDGEQILVNERDTVEIISGPFKGDRAKVVRIVPGKDEVIIEPLNMTVPIPITLSVDDIRVVDLGEKDE